MKIMEQMIYQRIELENGKTLVIEDLSREISAVAKVVIMRAVVEIKIERQLFSGDSLSDIMFNDVLATLGDTVFWEYTSERNFIMNKDKDLVFEQVVKTFLANLGQYIAKPEFPGKFILKKYKDRIKATQK